MAKKFDNDFDADSFVDNFRSGDNPPPSQTKSDNKEEKPAKKDESRHEPHMDSDGYRSAFIDDLKYRFPGGGWSQVKIHPDFTSTILYLENICRAQRANLSTYINNVLEHHFREFGPQIEKLRKQHK